MVNTKFEPLNFHLAKTYPLIEPITAEIIDAWTTNKRVRTIDSEIDCGK